MSKFFIILLLTSIYQFQIATISWAEIRNYTLNQIEITDETGNPKLKPLQANGKRITDNLVIAGLGTSKVTAQCPTLSLSIETQIFPLDKNNGNGTGVDASDWYYVFYNLGVTLIELNGDRVKVHNLGEAPYTLVGTREKEVRF